MNVIVGKNARVTFYDCLLRKSMLRIAPAAAAREKLMTNLLLTTSVRDYVTNAKVEYCQKLKGVAAALIRNCAIHIKRRMTE